MYSDSKNLLWACVAVSVGVVAVILIVFLVKMCLHIYVKHNSMRYHKLKTLNDNTHFHNVDVEKWSERFDSKKKFDSYGATKFKTTGGNSRLLVSEMKARKLSSMC